MRTLRGHSSTSWLESTECPKDSTQLQQGNAHPLGTEVWVSIRAPLSLRVALGNLLTALHPRLLTRNTRLPQMGV